MAKLKKVFQIGLVVMDAKKSAEVFCEIFSIDKSNIQLVNMKEIEAIPIKYQGKLVEAYNFLAIVKLEQMEFEFIQYLGGDNNSQKDFYAHHGAGIQHICVSVEDYDTAIADMKEYGGTVLVEGGDEQFGYGYMDMREQVGMIFEIYNDNMSKIMGV